MSNILAYIIGGVVIIGAAIYLIFKPKTTDTAPVQPQAAPSTAAAAVIPGVSNPQADAKVSDVPSSTPLTSTSSGAAGVINSIAVTAQAGIAAQCTPATRINLGGTSLNTDAYYVGNGVCDHNGTYYTGYGAGTISIASLPAGTTIGGVLVTKATVAPVVNVPASPPASSTPAASQYGTQAQQQAYADSTKPNPEVWAHYTNGVMDSMSNHSMGAGWVKISG